ncbi:Structural maintenance of chromosomes protein 3 [Elasticomyces elasticus]|nr:Structural maintenance of chromosomes protein 3 [Elasticomyces elasticus]
MSREERGGLLHKGAGSAVMSAYVEVIFDNADQRFPIDTPEVILRRTIGQKKDEYSLNRKSTMRQEATNMLKTAGFSTSNPYYIVPQGRITAITNVPDAGRLDILKEVAGTKVYKERRAASQNIMDDTEHRRTKIDEFLDHFRGRLGELKEEKEELRVSQNKDRARRCLEYTIHHKDQEALQEASEKLQDVENKRAQVHPLRRPRSLRIDANTTKHFGPGPSEKARELLASSIAKANATGFEIVADDVNPQDRKALFND